MPRKLRWFERLTAHGAKLYTSKVPVILAGDFNVVPTDFDIYNPRSWRKDALLQPESRACWERLLGQGWADAIRHLYPDERVFTFWDYFRQHGRDQVRGIIAHVFPERGTRVPVCSTQRADHCCKLLFEGRLLSGQHVVVHSDSDHLGCLE